MLGKEPSIRRQMVLTNPRSQVATGEHPQQIVSGHLSACGCDRAPIAKRLEFDDAVAGHFERLRSDRADLDVVRLTDVGAGRMLQTGMTLQALGRAAGSRARSVEVTVVDPMYSDEEPPVPIDQDCGEASIDYRFVRTLPEALRTAKPQDLVTLVDPAAGVLPPTADQTPDVHFYAPGIEPRSWSNIYIWAVDSAIRSDAHVATKRVRSVVWQRDGGLDVHPKASSTDPAVFDLRQRWGIAPAPRTRPAPRERSSWFSLGSCRSKQRASEDAVPPPVRERARRVPDGPGWHCAVDTVEAVRTYRTADRLTEHGQISQLTAGEISHETRHTGPLPNHLRKTCQQYLRSKPA